jgi:hypothetical protein
MSTRVHNAVTAGAALVGAGVMAVTPAAQQAPEVLRSVNADVALAAAPQPYTQSMPELFALSAQRTVTGLASAPVGLATAAIALAQGQNPAAQAILKEVVDGPQWAADPAIYAFDDLLPQPVGGDANNDPTKPDANSAISQFRADVLIAARDDVNEAIADSLGAETAQPAGNAVSPTYAVARLGGGLAVSGLRAAQSAVTAPLGLVAVAQGLQKSLDGGGNKDLYLALQAYIDGPNYVTDPIVFAADDVQPQPAGGDTETDPAKMNGSEISQLCGNVLLGPRDNVRKVVAGALGVDPVTGNAPTNASTMQLSKTTGTTEKTGPVSRVLNSLKATPGGAATESTVGKHRAPATGGLSNLFKNKEDNKADTAPSQSPE